MRKNIFDLYVERYDLAHELRKLDEMYSDAQVFGVNYHASSLADALEYTFADWEYRGTCRDVNEFIARVGIHTDYPVYSKEDMPTIAMHNIEVYYNLFKLSEKYISEDARRYGRTFGLMDEGELFIKIIDSILVKLSSCIKEINENKYVVIAINEEAVSVAEMEKSSGLSEAILMYNHYSNIGEIEAKRVILSKLSLAFEAFRDKQTNPYGEDFAFIVNKADIRHNNTEISKKPILDGLNNEQIEHIYDIAYKLYLMAKMRNEYNATIKDEVRNLKQK